MMRFCHRSLSLGAMVMFLGGVAVNLRGAETPQLEAQLSTIVLYSTGMGYFEYSATVQDNQDVAIPIDQSDLNDVLKTLVVEDASGGHIVHVGYDRNDSVEATLDSLDLNVQEEASLTGILRRLRGEFVKLTVKGLVAESTVHGRIVGVEESAQLIFNELVTVQSVVLMDGDELRRVAIHEIHAARFEDPKWNAEMTRALALLRDSKQENQRRLHLRCEGIGKRVVRVGYLKETPVWKVVYRLILSEQAAQLQGWAIVENETDIDWKDVQLTLVHGQPASFRMDLREPLFTLRPEVDVLVSSDNSAQIHQSADITRQTQPAESALVQNGMGGMGGGMMGGGAFSGMGFGSGYGGRAVRTEPGLGNAALPDFSSLQGIIRDSDKSAPLGQAATPQEGVSAEATTAEVASSFVYRLDKPVQIDRHRSSMLPIVQQRIDATRVSLFNSRTSGKSPLLAVQLHNNTSLELAHGPVTVFDAGKFAGEGLLGFLPDGELRVLSYGRDLNVVIRPDSPQEKNEILSISLADPNQLKIESIKRISTQYHVAKREKSPKNLLLELPRMSLGKWEKPTQLHETTDSWERFWLELRDDNTTIDTVQAIPQANTVAIDVSSADTLVEMIKDAGITAEARKHLEIALELREATQAANRARAEVQLQVTATEKDIQRIQTSLTALRQDDKLYRRFADQLAKLEEQLAELRERDIQCMRDVEQRTKKLNVHTATGKSLLPQASNPQTPHSAKGAANEAENDPFGAE